MTIEEFFLFLLIWLSVFKNYLLESLYSLCDSFCHMNIHVSIFL